MLNEDQVGELLQACEAGVGHRLETTRGNLRTARHRAAAIWELLVLDSILRLGRVEYERPIAGPYSKKVDAYLHVDQHRGIWIEAAYLLERSVDNERLSDLLRQHFHKEGKNRGIASGRLWSRVDGELTAAGFTRRLPAEHELNRLFADRRLKDFFKKIQVDPSAPATCDMRPDHTVTLGYDPSGKSWSGGLVEDVPRTIEEHAIYRTLEEKADQHHGVPGPYVVCVGSDRSPAVGRLQTGIRPECAITAACAKWSNLSAVVLVSIEARPIPFEGVKYAARSDFYVNPRPHHPLTSSEIQMLRQLDFNSWRYSRPHNSWKPPKDQKDSRRHSGGRLMYKQLSNGNVEIEIPAWLVLDALRGGNQCHRCLRAQG